MTDPDGLIVSFSQCWRECCTATLIVRQQLSPAAALRHAQREMRASPRWQSPFYWAAFTLIGDWR